MANNGRDSEPLRDDLDAEGFVVPVIPAGSNGCGHPGTTAGGGTGTAWRVERTNAWLHSYRGLSVRWCHCSFMYAGLTYLSFIHLAL